MLRTMGNASGVEEVAEKMLITECRMHLLTYKYTKEEAWRWSGGVAEGQSACLVELRTDKGLSGLGEINVGRQVPGVVSAALEALMPAIVGQEPWDIQRLWARMYKSSIVWGRRGLALGVIGGIEIALWDLVGKATGRPVVDLLGGRLRSRLRAYASGGIRYEPGKLEDDLRSYVDKGFTAVKVRIGGRTVPENVEIARRAREAVGDHIDLMLDAGQGYVAQPWSVPDAIRVARALEPFEPFWLEEPYLTDEPDGYAAIRRKTRIPIAGGENGVASAEFKSLLDAQALDIVQPDATVAGGILECRKVASMAAERSIPVANHTWGSSVAVAANLHCLAATPNALIAEFPSIPNPLRDALFVEPLRVEDGYLHLPEVPGLGVQISDELLERFTTRHGVFGQRLAQVFD